VFRLDGKVALVTGCGTLGEGWGNGKAISVALARQGASIFGSDLNIEAAQQTKKIIEDEGGVAHVMAGDATQADEVKKLVDACMAQYGRIDILINNAGITQDARLVKMTEAQFDTVIDVNLKGVFNCTQIVVPHMLEVGSGAVVNASSVVGIYGNFGQTNYSATKFGVIGFTKTWARELGPKGIRVNAVCPGFIATEMVKAMPENILKDIERRSWLGRLGTPEEMANVYLFLASDEASYVNGVAFEASGGISL